MPALEETSFRVTPSRRQAEDWALALTAAGIPHKLERTPAGWALIVAWRDEERVASELDAVQSENLVATHSTAAELEYGTTYVGFALAALFLAFYFITGSRDAAVIWFRAGSASADAILEGELWRTVTALTLHADAPHVLGNAVSCVIFVTAVCRTLGPGIGSWLILLAGAVGNAITAYAHGTGHSSVGASTALFGAVGILAGLQFAMQHRRLPRRRRAWVPIAAGLALLAMLGTGRNADIAAHFFGFAVGIPLGAAAALAVRRPPTSRLQWPLALIAAGAVVGCWLIALS
jgi:membrane associated rhomboid family serine protease